MLKNRNALEEAAFRLGEEIHGGRWDHVTGIHAKPAPDCPEIVAELERRCPGFSREEYQRAIADGLFASR